MWFSLPISPSLLIGAWKGSINFLHKLTRIYSKINNKGTIYQSYTNLWDGAPSSANYSGPFIRNPYQSSSLLLVRWSWGLLPKPLSWGAPTLQMLLLRTNLVPTSNLEATTTMVHPTNRVAMHILDIVNIITYLKKNLFHFFFWSL